MKLDNVEKKGQEMTDEDKQIHAQFKSRLPIDLYELEKECAQQPIVYDDIGEWVSEIKAKAKIAKEHVEFVKAGLSLTIRKNPTSYGLKEKPTEGSIAVVIALEEDYRLAFREYIDADKLANEASVLLTAAEQRKSSIRDLVRLYVNSYFSKNDALGDEDWKQAEQAIIEERNRRASEEEDRKSDNVEEE